jgi:energy-coupling factor transporter ATP-binding protein EcfA2
MKTELLLNIEKFDLSEKHHELIEELHNNKFPEDVVSKIKAIILSDNNFLRYAKIQYLVSKTLLQYGFCKFEKKRIDDLTKYVEHLEKLDEVFIELFQYNAENELFTILEEEFLSNKVLDYNFFSRVNIFLVGIVKISEVVPKKYFELDASKLTEQEQEIISLLDKNEIADVFEKLAHYSLSTILTDTYKERFMVGSYNFNSSSEFKNALIQDFKYRKVTLEIFNLANMLRGYVSNRDTQQYFIALINLGLKDKKFDILKEEFIKGYKNISFYQELISYSHEAATILLNQAVKVDKEIPIILTKLDNSNVGSWDMFGNFTYEFQPQINLLLGRNGYGKTHLLRFIAAILQNTTTVVKKSYPSDYKLSVNWGDETHFFSHYGFWVYDKIPVLGITDARFLDKSGEIFQYQPVEEIRLETDGGYFLLNQKPMQGLINNLFVSLASQYIENKNKNLPANLTSEHDEIIKIPIFRLMSEVIFDLIKEEGELELTEAKEKFEFVKIQNLSNSFIGIAYQIWVRTEASPKPLPLQKVSQGTMSVLVIVGLIYDFLRVLYEKEDCTQEAGIVFIDEIDAHLHPFWQRKIIGLLRDKFPKVQFFLTAHSPLLVAGCKHGEVSVMEKDKQKGNFVVKTFENHFLGAEAEMLYHDVFGLKDLRDENYKKYLEEIPNAEKLRLEVEKLAEKDTLNEDDKKAFDKLYYIWQVMQMEDKPSKTIELINLKVENQKLRIENEQLKQK